MKEGINARLVDTGGCGGVLVRTEPVYPAEDGDSDLTVRLMLPRGSRG
jgi:hypothetical protein